MRPHAKKLVWAAAGLFSFGAITGFSAPSLLHTVGSDSATLPAAATAEPAPGAIPPGTAPNYHAIFKRNEAAVVSITSVGATKIAAEQPFDSGNLFGDRNPFGDQDNPFSQFFRNMPRLPQNRVPTRALGSGFIVSPNGIILTNAHVVDGAKTVTVSLSDHRELKAKVLGADRTSDIAVLKINASDLPTVRLGDSDHLEVGDYVMAIGAPFGLTETATSGIVSALGRSLPDDGYMSFIQTDAPVNPGNSGGPLFNATGAVVGITSQIYSNSGAYEGVAFAIPINYAESAESQIVKTGHVEHGQLGVEVQGVDQSLASSFGLQSPAGALVAKVEPNSPAARSGLKAGDVILKYDGATIGDSGQLAMRVNTTPPGQKATLEIWRDGKALTLTAVIGSPSGSLTASAAPRPGEQTHLGLTVRPLTPSERDQAGITHGLAVQAAQGPAAEAGIQQGDVVLAVNGTPVDSVAQMRELLHKDGKGKEVALLIQRGDNRMFVPVDLG
jgi:serine protease Do